MKVESMANRYVKGNSVVERKVRESRILVPLGNDSARLDSLYTLNPMASFVWDQAQLGLSDDEIVSRVADDYDVDQDTARRDTQDLLAQLVSIGALRRAQTQG